MVVHDIYRDETNAFPPSLRNPSLTPTREAQPQRMRILLICGDESALQGVKPLLSKPDIEMLSVRSCADARRLLQRVPPPGLIFTDTRLPDGSWAHVRAMAAGLVFPVPVIVASRVVDMNLYLDVLESGAADFIVPPFAERDLAYVMQGAILSVTRYPVSREHTTGQARVTAQ